MILSLVFIVCRFAVSTQWEQEVAEGRTRSDIHSYFCCCARRIGHMFALVSYPDGSPIIVAGPCWPFCIFVTCTCVCVCLRVRLAHESVCPFLRRSSSLVAQFYSLIHCFMIDFLIFAVPIILGVSGLVGYFVILENSRFDFVSIVSIWICPRRAFPTLTVYI